MRVYRLYIYIVCLFLVLLSLSQNNRCFFVGKAKQRFEICDKKKLMSYLGNILVYLT